MFSSLVALKDGGSFEETRRKSFELRAAYKGRQVLAAAYSFLCGSKSFARKHTATTNRLDHQFLPPGLRVV
jgi:hypothetical protein